MSTSPETLDFLSDALRNVPGISYKRMMGEYCVYSRWEIFGLICDNTLFLKTTPETIGLFDDIETKAYPWSKNTAQVNPEWLENPEGLARIVGLILTSLRKAREPIRYFDQESRTIPIKRNTPPT